MVTPREQLVDHNAMGDRQKASPMPRYPNGQATRVAVCSERSEWVPGRARRVFEIADIGAEPQADAGADRHQHDVVGGERGHAEAADDIGGAVDAGEALID